MATNGTEAAAAGVESAKPDKDELAALDALEKEASEFNKDAEIDRILKAFKLDAYAVLDLQPGCTETDIKITYRKKSLLIHPDKTSNPSAPAAFDKLKKAQTELAEEKTRIRLDEAIADARTLLMRELKLTPDSPEMRGELSGAIREQWRRKTVEVLVENEARRRKQLKAQMQEEGREQRKADEELEARKRKREHDVAWEDTREQRIGSWRDFAAGSGKKKGPGKNTTGGTGSGSGGAGGSGSGSGSANGVAAEGKEGKVNGEKKKKKLKVLG